MATQEIENLFTNIVERVKSLDPENTRKWFDDLSVGYFNGGSLRIYCPDESIAQYLEDKCKSTFTQAAQQATGYLVSVDFSAAETSKDKTEEIDISGLKLHPDYTFDNFVVGPSNRLAHASCIAISHSPGNTYNPLFIYGNSGLGKTHLLHAVCFETKRKNSNAVIRYHSCEDFVNRFIRAIERGDLAGFQDEFRNADMLLIDDVQFLSDREHSQEEFFHTFNALYNNGKQIILSSDSPPTEIKSLEERLISRFNWGLVTRVDPPSHDTRVAIVQKKSHLRGIGISDDVAEYVARKAQANIREIEGALTRIYAVAATMQKPVDINIARAALGGHAMTEVRHISITDIIDVVTDYFDVRLADLQSKKRSQSITEPRQICMYLARSLTRHSLEEIGGHLGGRDHTTVMHACSKIDKMQKNDTKTQVLLAQLTKQITQSPRG
ncbi:MAG: chromosomal replication initiator protein DnaA [Phycisphaerae bacterium]|nr:chromosomal replication initiator protein DnaA [Phycisphaerae bacterium]